MKIKTVNIDVYDWEVVFVFISKSDKDINNFGKTNNLLKEDIEEINDKIAEESINGGITIFNTHRVAFVILYSTTSKKQKINSLTHEIRHVVDKIMEYSNIEDWESPAYLTGYISGEILI